MKKLILAVLIALPVGLTSCKKDANFFINDWCYTDNNGTSEMVTLLSVKEGSNCTYTENNIQYTGSWNKVSENEIQCVLHANGTADLTLNFCRRGDALYCTNTNHEYCNINGSCAGTHDGHHGNNGQGCGHGQGQGNSGQGGHHGDTHH